MGRRSSWSPLAGVLALLAVLIVPAAATAYEEPEPRAEDATTRQEYVPGQLIVRFDPGASQGERADARRRNDLEKISDLPVADTELVRFRGQGTPPERARQAQGDNAVRVAEPNFLYHPATTDPEYGQLWGLDNTGQSIGYDAGDPGTADADIDAPEGWSAATTGGAVVVGVIDTGVQISHPDLKDRIVLNAGEIGDPADSDGNGVITIADLSPDLPADDLNGNGYFDPEDVVLKHTDGSDDDGSDGNGYVDDIAGYHFFTDTDPQSDNDVYDPYEGDAHGTHVSGTIAGTHDNGQGVAGVAPDAYILPIKFLGAEGGATSDAVRALDFAYAHGVTLTNNSWGGGGASTTLEQKIAEGPLFVAAAGNDGTNADSHYPSAYDLDNILSVASTTNDDTLSSFSNHSSTSVDLGAPGSGILSTVPEYTKAVVHDGTDYYSAFHSIGLEGIRNPNHRVVLVEAALQRAGLADGDSILLVDDDGGDAYETVWTNSLNAALSNLGLTNVSVNTHSVPIRGNPAERNGPSATEMDQHDLVIWFTGADFSSTLTGTDRNELSTYLDSDGTIEKLLLFGVDIAYDLDNNQTSASPFLQDVLHTDFVSDIDRTFRVKGASASTDYADVPSPIDLESGDTYPGHYYSDQLHPVNGGEAALLSYAYNWYSGTSMATPHVSGAAAVLYGENPALTVAEVKEALMLGGDPLAALDGTTVSGNRLNLSGSVAYIPDACGPDANEPNDGSGSATPLTSGEPVNGEICPTGDEDWFSIEAQAGDTITADLTYDSSAGDLNIELYGPDGEGGLTLLDSSAGSSGDHESVFVTSAAGGSYYLMADGLGSASKPYTVEFATLMLSRFEESDAAFEFSSGWSSHSLSTRSGDAIRRTGTAGETMEVLFTGPVVRWVAAVAPVYGEARVSIDGVSHGTVDLYSPTWQFQQEVFVASGLGDGTHQLTITVLGTANASATGTLVEVDAVEAAGVVPVVRFEESDAAFEFSSGWSSHSLSTRSGDAIRRTGTAGETMEVLFTGPVVRWVAAVAPVYGEARVSIDGVSHGTVDLYSPTWQFQQEVFVASGLGDGTHQLTITVLGTANASATGTLVEVDAVEAAGVVPVVRFEESDAAFEFSSGWSSHSLSTRSGDAIRRTGTAGETMEVLFTGPVVRWVAAVAPVYGEARVSIDGVSHGTVDLYSPTWQFQQEVFVASGLGDGTHQLTITVLGTANASATGTLVEVDAVEAAGVVPVVRFEESDAAFEFSSGWSSHSLSTRSGDAIRRTGTAGETMEVLFTGPVVRWVAAVAPVYGEARVSIDGVSHGTVDLYSPTWQFQQEVFVASGLGDGTHQLTITVLGTANASATGTLVEVDAAEAAGVTVGS